MAHLAFPGADLDLDHDYAALQQRLDRNVTGAPKSPTFDKILRLLFTPEEARIARFIPQFISLDALAKRTGVPREDLDEIITRMAKKGLVIDIEQRGRRFASLAPVVIGFYEFTFMRTRDDAPMETLAALFEQYFDEGALPRAIFRMNTQIGRSLVREETIPEDRQTEVLDWERATAIVASAPSVAVSLCPCRHHAQLIGRGCNKPLRTCLSFGSAADSLVRAELAESVTNEEALKILAECKAAGLAQTADNVQHGVSYMCNCCGCCCGMMRSIKRFGLTNGIVHSNWLATVDHTRCHGCGKCVKACPVDAIHLEPTHGEGLRRNWAIIDAEKCLGCGVCQEVCRWEARVMEPRAERVDIPYGMYDRVIAMAIERGKVGDLLLDQMDGAAPQAVARVLHVLEQTPVPRALVAIEPLRSAFLGAMVTGMRRMA